jgi:ABC-type maltose transport system permease subunit
MRFSFVRFLLYLLMTAAALLFLMPVAWMLVMFLLFQRHIIRGVVLAGLKG